jgi:hypothetical protein
MVSTDQEKCVTVNLCEHQRDGNPHNIPSRGHWYHTIYQQRIGKYSLDSTEPFQFLEIGFYEGKGYETYRDFLSQSTEVHSMEISCLPKGAREEGKVSSDMSKPFSQSREPPNPFLPT